MKSFHTITILTTLLVVACLAGMGCETALNKTSVDANAPTPAVTKGAIDAGLYAIPIAPNQLSDKPAVVGVAQTVEPFIVEGHALVGPDGNVLMRKCFTIGQVRTVADLSGVNDAVFKVAAQAVNPSDRKTVEGGPLEAVQLIVSGSSMGTSHSVELAQVYANQTVEEKKATLQAAKARVDAHYGGLVKIITAGGEVATGILKATGPAAPIYAAAGVLKAFAVPATVQTPDGQTVTGTVEVPPADVLTTTPPAE